MVVDDGPHCAAIVRGFWVGDDVAVYFLCSLGGHLDCFTISGVVFRGEFNGLRAVTASLSDTGGKSPIHVVYLLFDDSLGSDN